MKKKTKQVTKRKIIIPSCRKKEINTVQVSKFTEPAEQSISFNGTAVVVETTKDSIKFIELLYNANSKNGRPEPQYDIANSEMKNGVPSKPMKVRQYRTVLEIKGLGNSITPDQVVWSEPVKEQ